MHILVTGGTGALGRQVVSQLAPTAHTVSVLSRRTALPDGFPECQLRTADLATGQGLTDALTGVDAVIHCASNPGDLRGRTDVNGTQNLIAAARAGSAPQIIYISIVGCDQIPVPYYKAKHRAEQIVEQSGLPWAVLRATQFHDLLHQILRACSKPPVAIVPKGFRFQPVNSGDVADILIDVTVQGLTRRQPDFGGPEEADIRHWMDLYLTHSRHTKRVIEAPVPGRIGSAFRAGKNTVRSGERGAGTFEEFLTTTTR